jgi:hypothetical protein
MEGLKMYRIQKEVNHIQNDNQCFFYEGKNLNEVKEYLLKNNCEYIRYSKFTNTIYYKDKK